jgi:hypothetical protein
MLAFWWRPLAFVLGIALFSFLFFSGRSESLAWAVFAAGLLAYLVYQLSQLRRFSEWAADPTRPPLQGDGVWGDALYRLEKIVAQPSGGAAEGGCRSRTDAGSDAQSAGWRGHSG